MEINMGVCRVSESQGFIGFGSDVVNTSVPF